MRLGFIDEMMRYRAILKWINTYLGCTRQSPYNVEIKLDNNFIITYYLETGRISFPINPGGCLSAKEK
jgi:hypothetical protein